MNQKEITIQGKQYPVVVDMQTIMNYEEVTNCKSFFTEEFTTLKSRIALIIAAVITADEKTDLTVEAITGEKDIQAVQEIIAAYAVVMQLVGEFFKVPEIEPKDEKPEETAEEEEQTKN